MPDFPPTLPSPRAEFDSLSANEDRNALSGEVSDAPARVPSPRQHSLVCRRISPRLLRLALIFGLHVLIFFLVARLVVFKTELDPKPHRPEVKFQLVNIAIPNPASIGFGSVQNAYNLAPSSLTPINVPTPQVDFNLPSKVLPTVPDVLARVKFPEGLLVRTNLMDGLGNQMSQLLFELPLLADGTCPLSDVNRLDLHLNDVKIHTCTVLVRGVVEQATYVGGETDGYVCGGGTPQTGVCNIYELDVDDPPQTYFLNAGVNSSDSGIYKVYLINYSFTVQIKNGSHLTLRANSIDKRELGNDQALVVPDVDPLHPVAVHQPYNGQFIQIDATAFDVDAGGKLMAAALKRPLPTENSEGGSSATVSKDNLPDDDASADDDPLPNFNAPVDQTPLNADKVNRTLGIDLFKDGSLWNEDAAVAARRLGWPQQSMTTTQSSYRLYADPAKPLTVSSARAYSCVLYATKSHPTEVSIVFANQGDYAWKKSYLAEAKRMLPDITLDPDFALPIGPDNRAPLPIDVLIPLDDGDRESVLLHVQNQFEDALKADARSITRALTKLFGKPQHMGYGGVDLETRERVLRWDWQGHAFLVASPKDAYVSLRVVPTSIADHYGKADDEDSDTLKAELAQRVKQYANGDVVVTDIPMVDQGPKGYCVPATWERYLRYMGIPADMYVLANSARTSQNGTVTDDMVQTTDSLVTLYHRRIEGVTADLDLQSIAKRIDAGLPLIWDCDVHDPFDDAISKRMADRAKVTDWSAWSAKLALQDKTEIPTEITNTHSIGHERMIIGYNAATKEIAISDSWSQAYSIRWLTLDEANAISLGRTLEIEP